MGAELAIEGLVEIRVGGTYDDPIWAKVDLVRDVQGGRRGTPRASRSAIFNPAKCRGTGSRDDRRAFMKRVRKRRAKKGYR